MDLFLCSINPVKREYAVPGLVAFILFLKLTFYWTLTVKFMPGWIVQ
jgi:hypothetical protein